MRNTICDLAQMAILIAPISHPKINKYKHTFQIFFTLSCAEEGGRDIKARFGLR